MEKSNIGVFFSADRFQEAAKDWCVILNSSAEILLEAEDIVGVVFWFPSGDLFYPLLCRYWYCVCGQRMTTDRSEPKKLMKLAYFFVFS